jgi:hypothetical protein
MVMWAALIALVMLVAVSLPVSAQETTLEATPTPEPGMGPIVEPEPPTVWSVIPDAVTALVGAVTLFAGGTFFGAAGVAVYLQRLKDDTPTVTAFERIYNSVPESVANKLLDIVAAGRAGVELLEEITDGKPVEEKEASA